MRFTRNAFAALLVVGLPALLLGGPAQAASKVCKLAISGNDAIQYDKFAVAVLNLRAPSVLLGFQLGGVLEPVNASPVVVEDDVVVGGNCGIYEGTVVRRRAVIGAGVVLTRGTPVYDLERQTVHRAENGKPLVIPENAVVVPGARAVKGDWGQAQGISLQTPVIVKYRDEKTDAATALESWLR